MLGPRASTPRKLSPRGMPLSLENEKRDSRARRTAPAAISGGAHADADREGATRGTPTAHGKVRDFYRPRSDTCDFQ